MKKKKVLATVCAFSIAFGGLAVLPEKFGFTKKTISVYAENLTNGNFEYKILDDGTVEITDYNGTDENVVFPSEIDGKTVTDIKDWIFDIDQSIKSVYLPDNITNISDSTFYNSSLENITVDEKNEHYSSQDGILFNKDKTELILYPPKMESKNYTIPNSVKSIGRSAFLGCNFLESVAIPNSVKSIGELAFSSCDSIKSITIPDSVTDIGRKAFDYSKSLENISIDEKNKTYSSQDGILFNKGKTKLLFVPMGTKLKNYTIPSGVKNIETFAFKGCAIENLIISDSVTSIGYGAFYNCSSLKNAIIPDSVTYIGAMAFYECSSLEKVTIPNSLKNIESSTFMYCHSLSSVTIPESVTDIGLDAFCDCSSIKNINIPANVINIEYDAFSGCTSLESITVDENNKNYSSQYGILFDKDKTELIYCPAGTKLKSYTIPDSIKNIDNSAFYECKSLEKINIPDSVTNIGGVTFWGCTALLNITIPENVTEIGSHALGYNYNEKSYEIEKINGFKIYCFKDTAGEKYAVDNEFDYEIISDETTTDDSTSSDKETTGETVYLAGDIDGNGKVNTLDALAILKHIVGLSNLSEQQKSAADLDGNGKITSSDALVILKYIVGIIDTF